MEGDEWRQSDEVATMDTHATPKLEVPDGQFDDWLHLLLDADADADKTAKSSATGMGIGIASVHPHPHADDRSCTALCVRHRPSAVPHLGPCDTADSQHVLSHEPALFDPLLCGQEMDCLFSTDDLAALAFDHNPYVDADGDALMWPPSGAEDSVDVNAIFAQSLDGNSLPDSLHDSFRATSQDHESDHPASEAGSATLSSSPEQQRRRKKNTEASARSRARKREQAQQVARDLEDALQERDDLVEEAALLHEEHRLLTNIQHSLHGSPTTAITTPTGTAVGTQPALCLRHLSTAAPDPPAA